MPSNPTTLSGTSTLAFDAATEEVVEMLPNGTEQVLPFILGGNLWLLHQYPFAGSAYDYEIAQVSLLAASQLSNASQIPIGVSFSFGSAVTTDGRLIVCTYNATSGFLEMRVLSPRYTTGGVPSGWTSSDAIRLVQRPGTGSIFRPVVRVMKSGTNQRVMVCWSEYDNTVTPNVYYTAFGAWDVGPSTITIPAGSTTGTYAVGVTQVAAKTRVVGPMSANAVPSHTMDYAHDGTGRAAGAAAPHVFIAVRAEAGTAPNSGLIFVKGTWSTTTNTWTWGPYRTLDAGVQATGGGTDIHGAFDGNGRFVVVAWLKTASTTSLKLFARNAGDTQTLVAADITPAPSTLVLQSVGLTYDAFGNIYIVVRPTASPSNLQWIKWTRATAAFDVAWHVPSWTTGGTTGVLNTTHTGYSLKKTIAGSVVGLWAFVSTAPSTTTGAHVWVDKLAVTNQPPPKPAWTAPLSGTSVDFTQAQTFQWSAPDPDAGDVQRAYALKRKVGTGTEQWWNGTDWSSTTEVYNVSAVPSVTFAANAAGSNGTTYDFAVAVQDTSFAASPYSDWDTIRGSIAPSVVLTAPASSVTDTARPVGVWTTTDPEGDPQEAYEFKVYANTGGGTPNPDVDDPLLSSGGVVSGPGGTATSWKPPVSLPSGQSYFYAVRVRTAGQWSTWATKGFTITLVGPAAPIVEALPDDDGARVILDLRTGSNRMGADEADLEGGTGGWSANNGTVTQDSTHVAHGAAALKVVATGATAMKVKSTARAGTGGFPVVKGRSYYGQVMVQGSVGTRTWTPRVKWTPASGSTPADTVGTGVVIPTGTMTAVTVVVTAPANGFAELQFDESASAASETFWFDQFGWAEGTAPVWSPGGLVGSESITVSRSLDGGNSYDNVRFTELLAFDATTGATEGYDYEIPCLTTALFQAFTEVPFADGTLASAASAPVSARLQFGVDVLRPVSNPAAGIVGVMLEAWTRTVAEAAEVFETAGFSGVLTYPIVETEGPIAPRGPATFWTTDGPSTAALRAVIESGDAMVLLDSKGNAWYVVVGPNGRQYEVQVTADPTDASRTADAYHVSTELVAISRP